MLYALLAIFAFYFAIMWTGSFVRWTEAKSRENSRKYFAEVFINTFLIMAFIILVGVLSK